jgi:hypothetical protein
MRSARNRLLGAQCVHGQNGAAQIKRLGQLALISGVVLIGTVLLGSCNRGGTPRPTLGPTAQPTTVLTPTPFPVGSAIGTGDIPAAQRARQALAKELGLDVAEVRIRQVVSVQWPDTCLGVQLPGQVCAFHVVQGYRVILEANGQEYEYHTNTEGSSLVPAIALVWLREDGVSGFCQDLFVDVVGRATTRTCHGEVPPQTEQMLMDSSSRARLYAWLNALQPFELDQHDPAAGDAVTFYLTFNGHGTTQASELEKEAIAVFAARLYAQMATTAAISAPLGTPPAAFASVSTVGDFLESLLQDPSGSGAMIYLSQSLQTYVQSGVAILQILDIESLYRSFGVQDPLLKDDGKRVYVAVDLNGVSHIQRALGLIPERGVWRIDTIISYAVPPMAVPSDLDDADNTVLDYLWAVKDKQPQIARALLAPKMGGSADSIDPNADVDAIEQLSILSLRLSHISSEHLIYDATLWVTPKADRSSVWQVGVNVCWFELVQTAEGWRIGQITTSAPTG